MHRNSFELSVLINGKPVREYNHEGRFYIEGRNDSEFEILVRNNSGKKIEAIISVDGLDVLDGETGNTQKPGYIIYPWSSLRIPGWRLNNNEVAHFQFGSQNDSYAAQKGKPRNVGVIGVAVFKEKEREIRYWYPPVVIHPPIVINPMPWTLGQPGWNPIHHKGTISDSVQGTIGIISNTSQTLASNLSYNGDSVSSNVNFTNCSAGADVKSSARCSSAGGAPVASQGLGTAFGRRTESAVTNVQFERASNTPDDLLEIRYNDRENLERRGIRVAQPLTEDLVYRETAKPFEDLTGGCTPPTNWKG